MKILKNILLLLCLTELDACNVNVERVRSVEQVELCIKEDTKKQTNVTDVIGKTNDIEVKNCNLSAYTNEVYEKRIGLVDKHAPDMDTYKRKLMVYLMMAFRNSKAKYIKELSNFNVDELHEQLNNIKDSYAMIRYIYEERDFIREVAPEYADYVEGYGNYRQEIFVKAMYMIEDYKQCSEVPGTNIAHVEKESAKVFEHNLINFEQNFKYFYYSGFLNDGLRLINNIAKRAELNARLNEFSKTHETTDTTDMCDKAEIEKIVHAEMEEESIENLVHKKLILDAMEGQSATDKLEFLLNTCVRVRSKKLDQLTKKDICSGVIFNVYDNIKKTILHLPEIHAFRIGCEDPTYIAREGETSLSTEVLSHRVKTKMSYQNAQDTENGISVADDIIKTALRGREELNLEEIEEFCKEVSSEAQAYIDGKRASKLIPYETSALNSSATKKRIEESVKNSSFDKISYVGHLYEEVDKMMKTTDSDEERKEKLAEAYVYFLMLEELTEKGKAETKEEAKARGRLKGNARIKADEELKTREEAMAKEKEEDIGYVAKIENANDEVLEKVTQTLKSQYNNSYSV